MRKLLILACSFFALTQGFAKSCCEVTDNALLIGRPAPTISTKAVLGPTILEDFNLEAFQGQYVILFFYPLDFTFVCPTELLAFQDKLEEFQARNAQVIACSVDSPFSHLAWLNTPTSEGGIAGVEFPIIADLDKSVSRSFRVLNEKRESPTADSSLWIEMG